VDNLQKRFSRGKIYTYIGEVLISTNPYADLGIYTDAVLQDYRSRAIYEVRGVCFILPLLTIARIARHLPNTTDS
jgi:myosin heavy subunit